MPKFIEYPHPHSRSALKTETGVYTINLMHFRTWNDLSVLLPEDPSNDDMGLHGYSEESFGAESPCLKSWVAHPGPDTTAYARVQWFLPAEYVDGGLISLFCNINFATEVDELRQLDAEVFKADGIGGAGSDICATGIASLSTGTTDQEFAITPTGIVSGDTIDIRLKTVLGSGGGGGSGAAKIGRVQIKCDVKG